MDKQNLRLNITSVSGMANLFLYLNYTEAEKKETGDPLTFLAAMMKKCLEKKYPPRVMDDSGIPKSPVALHDTHAGFCLSVCRISPDETQTLELFTEMLDYVEDYDIPALARRLDEECARLAAETFPGTRELAAALRREVLEQCSYSFQSEFWSLFD